MTRRLLTLLSLGLVALAMPFSARAANLLQNGSLEDLNHSFVNTTCGYEALFANSTAIADWTVSSSTINEVAWGNGPTCDGFQAADGTFFVDLTGFGFDSPNGALEQQMHNLIVNKTYRLRSTLLSTDRCRSSQWMECRSHCRQAARSWLGSRRGRSKPAPLLLRAPTHFSRS